MFCDVDNFFLLDKDHQRVPFIEKVLAVDKYSNLKAVTANKYNRLAGTKNMVMNEFKKADIAREVNKSDEYAALSEGMKIEFLERVVDASKFL